jgi:hypothetical protein
MLHKYGGEHNATQLNVSYLPGICLKAQRGEKKNHSLYEGESVNKPQMEVKQL